MAYTVDPFDDTRPVGADDAGELTNELRQIKTQLKRFRDGVEKDFNELYETMSEADGGLPLELGGTGVQSLNGLKELLGLSGEEAPVGIGGLAAFGAGTHLWQVPTELRNTGRKFIVVLAGAGGSGYNYNNNKGNFGQGGNGGLAIYIGTTSETSIQVVCGNASIGSDGGKSTFGTILEALGGQKGDRYRSGDSRGATGGILNIFGGGSKGGRGAYTSSGTQGRAASPGFCVIVW